MSQCTNTTTAGSSSCQSFRQGESSLPMVAECLSKFTSSKKPQHHKEKRKPHLVKVHLIQSFHSRFTSSSYAFLRGKWLTATNLKIKLQVASMSTNGKALALTFLESCLQVLAFCMLLLCDMA